MNLPLVLDACTIINLLRIDDEGDEYLYKKIKSLKLFISDTVYNEVLKNTNNKPIEQYQKDAINHRFPSFAHNIVYLDLEYRKIYTEEIKKYCSYHKDNGEFQSALLSLFLCRKLQCRLVFYTDDSPAKKDFNEFFVFQQIGAIGDTVDFLLFLYWSTPDFSIKYLEKYLTNLHGEYATQLKLLFNEISKNKDRFIKEKIKDAMMKSHLTKIETGYSNLDLDLLNEGITYFVDNKVKYDKIYNIINKYKDVYKGGEITIKIRNIQNKIKNHQLYKI